MVERVALMAGVGALLTVILTVAVFVQLFDPVPVTVYVVETVGEAVGVAELLVNPTGLLTHAYVLAPVVVKFALAPEHTAETFELAVIVGFGLIVKTTG